MRREKGKGGRKGVGGREKEVVTRKMRDRNGAETKETQAALTDYYLVNRRF